MNTLDHIRLTYSLTGSRSEAALAALPDVFVGIGKVTPSPTVKRWCAWAHHSDRAERWARALHPVLGEAWAAHMRQDKRSHPPGTYQIPERAGLLSDRLVVAYSGGPDSFITWRMLGTPPAVYLDVGNASAGAEMDLGIAADRAFGDGKQIQFMNGGYPLQELASGWIPYRNLRIILACAQIEPNVVLARIAEWGPDKNPSFFRRTERLLASSRGGYFQAAQNIPKVRIFTPFGHLTKTQLVRRYLEEFGVKTGSDDLMRFTRSCYAGRDRFCGTCGACFCRWVAFTNNGIDERDRYEVIPNRPDYYRRLDWHDFRPGMVPMYVKRHREMRGFA